MVKFLCARQDTAERLGVQQMSFSGYLCPDSERLEDVEDLSTQAEGSVSGLVTGLTLMKKTLYFIQQLTRDMVHPPHVLSRVTLIYSNIDGFNGNNINIKDIKVFVALT